MNKTDLFDFVKNMALHRQSLYSDYVQDRESLISFLEMNNWFGFGESLKLMNLNTLTDRKIYITDEFKKILSDNITLWLDGFKKSNEEKFKLLTNFGKHRFPETVSIYEDFILEKKLESKNATWQLLDFFTL